jgi:dUTP pyrophosphatase
MSTILVERLPSAEGLPLPSYATEGAAGMDLLAAVAAPVTLRPGERALIPTGLRVALPAGHEWQIRPRSGLALKHGVTVANAPGTVDEDYRGEVKVILTTQSPFLLTLEKPVAQMVIVPYVKAPFVEANTLDATVRNAGGFGSTGKQ